MKVDELDISKMPDVLATINQSLRNGGIVEIKNEDYHGNVNVVVVEITRRVKTPRKSNR